MRVVTTERKKSLPFTYKMMVLYLVLVMLTDLTIGLYAYRSSIESRLEYTNADITRTLQQTRDNIQLQIKDVHRISDQLFSDYNLQQQLLSREQDYRIYDLMTNYLIPKLDSDVKLSLNPILLALYTDNPKIREIYTPMDNPLAAGGNYSIYSMNRIRSKVWFENLLKAGADSVWRQVENDADYGNLSYLRKLITFDTFEQIGYMRVIIRTEDLFQAVNTFRSREGTRLLLIEDMTGRVVHGNVPGLTGSVWKQEHKSEYLVKREKLEGTDWSLIAAIPYDALTADATRVRNLTLLVCGISFIVMCVLGFFITKYFSLRVKRIVSMILSFRNGEFSQRISYKGHDEFSQIASAFNGMADNIQSLIQEVYVSNLNKKEAELEALQAQINPHFLYNTLSSINSLANLGEIGKLSRMVSGLARFYRLTLNDGNMDIAIEKEVEQVQAYIDIQGIKYGNRFSVSCDIQEEILRCQTIKLILQPFVENILKHAWYEEKLHIRITGCREGDDVVFRIIDNGVGMSRETLHSLFNPGNGSRGYGIRNVDERIKLHFGMAYGVDIFSGKGIGTTVRITIPASP